MRRGTTPNITFNVNLDLTKAQLYISFAQKGVVVLEKTTNELNVESEKITCSLSQKDTLKLKKGQLECQIRYIFDNGDAGASNIMSANIKEILKDGEIVWS